MASTVPNGVLSSGGPGQNTPAPQLTSGAAGSHQNQGLQGTSSPHGNISNAPKSKLQVACQQALQNVQARSISSTNDWANAIVKAPTAISKMARFRKAADGDAVVGLEDNARAITGKDGQVKKQLPSMYFNANLRYCNKVGKQALQNAHSEMTAVQQTAQEFLNHEGGIAGCVQLLTIPDDGRVKVQQELDSVKNSVQECLKSAKTIMEDFEYWNLVVELLEDIGSNQKDKIRQAKDATKTKQTHAGTEETQYLGEKTNIELRVQDAQAKLKSAESEFERAQADVDRLRYEPPIPEPSIMDETLQARKLVPSTPPHTRNRGHFVKWKHALFGQSETSYKKDKELYDENTKRIHDDESNVLAKAQKQREDRRKEISGRLDAKREVEKDKLTALTEAQNVLMTQNLSLNDVNAKLKRVQDEISVLKKEELKFDDTFKALEDISKDLIHLRQVTKLLSVFSHKLHAEIDYTIRQDLTPFLTEIETHLQAGPAGAQNTNPGEIQSPARWLQFQGHMSAVTDICTTYTTLSTTHLLPALRKMDELLATPDAEWHDMNNEFAQWCANAVVEMTATARQTVNNIQPNMLRRLEATIGPSGP